MINLQSTVVAVLASIRNALLKFKAKSDVNKINKSTLFNLFSFVFKN